MAGSTKRALKNMRTYKLPAFAAILSIAMAVVIVGAFFVIFLNVRTLVTHWEAGNRVLIYLADNITESERQDLEASLNSIEGLTILRYIPKDEGLKYLEEEFGDQSGVLQSLGGNPLPDAFEAMVAMDTQAPWNIREIAANLESLPLVSDVEYGREWIERGHMILQFLRILGATLLVIFAIAGILVIVATLKLTIYALKHEMDTLRLIGASNGFIARPFYLQSIMETVLGTAIGLAVVYGLFTAATRNFYLDAFMLPMTYQPVFMDWPTMGLFVAAAVVTGIIGTFIALRGAFRL